MRQRLGGLSRSPISAASPIAGPGWAVRRSALRIRCSELRVADGLVGGASPFQIGPRLAQSVPAPTPQPERRTTFAPSRRSRRLGRTFERSPFRSAWRVEVCTPFACGASDNEAPGLLASGWAILGKKRPVLRKGKAVRPALRFSVRSVLGHYGCARWRFCPRGCCSLAMVQCRPLLGLDGKIGTFGRLLLLLLWWWWWWRYCCHGVEHGFMLQIISVHAPNESCKEP